MLVTIITLLLCRITFDDHAGVPEVNQELHTLDLKSIFHIQANEKKHVPKIAYIFAGSARSFICPSVHWSIRSHLIDSLGGEPYTFVRISNEDNVNINTGHGTLWKPMYSSTELNETLKVLNPRAITWFSFANQIEEMKANYPGPEHEVIRENDQRRYSMFFHRCMAYKMAQKYEKSHNIRFDWVVLVRLDAAWLDHMPPIETYSPDRAWISEIGYALLNDQFMLIPRQYSDYVYSLDAKIQKGVYCLGGPDVEHWKCDRAVLQSKNISQEKIDLTLSYCCKDRKGIDEDGYSEIIHKRHLAAGPIPVSVTRFPVYLTRILADEYGHNQCHPECERLQLHAKGWLAYTDKKAYKYVSTSPNGADTRYNALSWTDHTKCVFMKDKSFAWKPVPAVKMHTLRSVFPIDYSRPLYEQRGKIHPSILMDPMDLEAWRIHPTWNANGCLTYSFSAMKLGWSECVDHIGAKGGFRHSPEQSFFLKVVPHNETINTGNLMTYELELARREKMKKSGGVVSETMRIMMPNRHPKVWDWIEPLKCVTIAGEIRHGGLVEMQDCNKKDWKDKHQTFLTVRGVSRGSHAATTVGKIRVAADPSLCLSRAPNNDSINAPENNRLELLKCDTENHQHRIVFEFQFVN